MKRIVMTIIMIIMFTGTMMAQGKDRKSASSSICVKIIFPHSDYRKATNSISLKSKASVNITPNIRKNRLYIISRDSKKFEYKLNGKIDFNNFVSVINSIKDTLPPGDYIATCNINNSPVSYRFKIPS